MKDKSNTVPWLRRTETLYKKRETEGSEKEAEAKIVSEEILREVVVRSVTPLLESLSENFAAQLDDLGRDLRLLVDRLTRELTEELRAKRGAAISPRESKSSTFPARKEKTPVFVPTGIVREGREVNISVTEESTSQGDNVANATEALRLARKRRRELMSGAETPGGEKEK